jgi:hypothetical protein
VTPQSLEFFKHAPSSGTSSAMAQSFKFNPSVSLPPTPSTPLPPPISGSVSPAWDPSSQTPLPPEEPVRDRDPSWGSPPWVPPWAPETPSILQRHSEPCQRKKPRGRLDRTGGYKLRDALGLDDSVISEMKVCLMIATSGFVNVFLELHREPCLRAFRHFSVIFRTD